MSEMTATRIRTGAGILAATALYVLAARVLWKTSVPADLSLPSLDERAYFTDAELEQASAYRRTARALVAATLVVQALVVCAAAVWRRALAGYVERFVRGRLLGGAAVAVTVAMVATVVALPVQALAHRRRRAFGLSEQGYLGWLGDRALAFAVLAALLSLAVLAGLTLAARLGRHAWIAGSAAFIAGSAALVLAQPVVVDPLFNRFEPLRHPALARDVRELATRMNAEIETIEVADASRRTTAANAYVAGLGPSRRIVLYDTALDGSYPRAELRALVAHELAHVGRRHLWKGLAWLALLAVPGVYLVARLVGRLHPRPEPAAVPLALAVALVYAAATLPLQNAVSRRYEAEADWLALEATRGPAGAVGLERRLARDALIDPTPPRAWTFVFGTHPPVLDRIAMAEAWSAAE